MDYERLVSRHKDAVYRQMVRVCGNHDDAEDVLVEALLAAYRSLPQLRDEDAFRSWLAIVGRRVCSRIQKQESLRPVLSLSGLSEAEMASLGHYSDPETQAALDEMASHVQGIVKMLPTSLRGVYTSREILGHSAEETATELGITVAAVKSRLHRARSLVRKDLDQCICPLDALSL